MDAIRETQKRLTIVNQITNEIKSYTKGIVLGGSMAYGQNFSVNVDSDVDLAIIIDKQDIDILSKSKYFNNKVAIDVISSFKEGEINLFWITLLIEKVEVNCFIYEATSYKNFCLLKEDIRGYIQNEPSQYHICYGFDGKKIKFKRYVSRYKDGFIYERPSLANHKYWVGPLRSDYLFGHIVLHQKNSYVDEIEKIVWNITLDQLIKEYGKDLDLTKYNILNAYFVYQISPERVPQSVIDNIRKETEDRLN